MSISIIIVNYKTYHLTKTCLESVLTAYNDDLYIEIIVVDNFSNDGSIERLHEEYNHVAKIIVNDRNMGFSKANNIGIRNSVGKYVLLLNSDTVIQPETLRKCYDFMESSTDVGACGCKVLLPDGKLDKACKRSFPTPLNSLFNALRLDKIFTTSKVFGSYNLSYLDEDTVSDIDCIVGAYMFIRRKCLDSVGLLDEDYFMYGEDIDLCFRIKASGWRIVYYPKTSIVHYKGSSAKKKKWSMIWEFHKSMLVYYDKNLATRYGKITALLVKLGIYTRFLMIMIFNLFRR